jgi:hypothetical protein
MGLPPDLDEQLAAAVRAWSDLEALGRVPS